MITSQSRRSGKEVSEQFFSYAQWLKLAVQVDTLLLSNIVHNLYDFTVGAWWYFYSKSHTIYIRAD